ncbi:CAP domain-containing protein [uncultured Algibacter sp.]|uniref:CAP domain-containing protein n=1 Tax=uncultured Algibacter sp. TaxID=298659 RepID=UPI00260CA684|nr:CAP domain-containing protein [uncultured Algibacter sp.]
MKTYYSKTYLILICFALLIAATSCSKDDTTNEDDIEKEERLTVADEILQIVNDHRLSIGENTLEINTLATNLANEHTEYMIAQNDISHDDFNQRSDRLIDEENASRTGENVAYGQRSASAVMEAWLNSSGHRKNIERDFTHIGIGVIKNDAGVYYFTQIFLKKRPDNNA